MSALADGRYDVRYKLYDTVKASELSRQDQSVSGQAARRSNDPIISPAWSPDGKYIIYATEAAGRKSLMVVSVDGRVKQKLTAQDGDVRQPSRGPFLR